MLFSKETPQTPKNGGQVQQSEYYTPLLAADSHSTNIQRQAYPCVRRIPSTKLFSIVNRFEALGALSVSPKLSSFKSTPLYNSQNSTRGRSGAQKKRLSTIFSPGSKSPNRYMEVGSTGDIRIGQENINSSPEKKAVDSLTRRSRREKVLKSLSGRNSSISNQGGAIRISAMRSRPRWESNLRTTPLEPMLFENGVKKKHRSIKDMIQFYDGAVSPGQNAKAKSSLARTGSPMLTPLAYLRTDEKKSPVAAYVRSPAKSNRAYNQYDSTRKSLHTPSLRKRNLIFSSPDPFAGQSSPTSFTRRAMSPRKYNRRPTIENKPTALNTPMASPERGERFLVTPINGVKYSPSTRESRGRPPTSLRPRDNSQMSSDRRKIGSQIEELYRAKSMGRQRQNTDDISPEQTGRLFKPTQQNEQHRKSNNVIMTPRRRTSIPSQKSKVADMKNLWENRSPEKFTPGKTSPENKSPEARVSTSEKFPTRAVPFKASPIFSKSLAAPPQPPPPPPLPQISSNRTSGVSPRTIFEDSMKPNAEVSTSLNQYEGEEATMPANKPRRGNSNAIWDRLKLFEEDNFQKEQIAVTIHKKEMSFSGKIGNRFVNARKNFFELPSRRNTEVVGDEKKRASSSVKEIDDIAIEVQNAKADNKLDKKGAIGKWAIPGKQNRVSHSLKATLPSGNNYDGMNSPLLRSGSLEMVVKEAECGLKQPKPMRLVEMKRMMLLCREKAGFAIDKDRAGNGRLRKL